MNVHVIPLDDLVEHQALESCVCGPAYELVQGEDGDSGWLIVHHSLDGREQDEADKGGYQQ